MNKMKRISCLALGLCFAFSLALTGCGSKSNDGAKASTPAATAAATTAAAESTAAPAIDTSKEVALKWYVIGNGQQADADKVQAEASKYTKEKINATFTQTCFTWGDDYEKKMTAKVASGEEFDIAFTSNWALIHSVNVAKGAFVDITDLLDKYAPKTKALVSEATWKGAAINGRNYGIPSNKEMAHQFGFIINMKIANKYNMDLSTIKTFADIEPMLKTVKDGEKGAIYPLQAVTGESPYRVLDFEKIAGDDCPGAIYGDGRDTKAINDFDTQEAKDLFTTMHKFYQAGYVKKDADTDTNYAADTKAGKVFAAVRQLKPGKDAELSLAEGQEWKQIELTKPNSTTREMTGALQAVSKSSKNPERALMFLELVNTDPYLNNLINFGIEGTHYVKVSDQIIDKGPAFDKYNTGTAWEMGNNFINYVFKTEDPQKWAKYKAFNEAATISPLMGFSFDSEPVKTKIAALTAVKKQFVPALEVGKSDPAVVVPQMNKKYADSGLADVLTEMQKQIDAFLAKK